MEKQTSMAKGHITASGMTHHAIFAAGQSRQKTLEMLWFVKYAGSLCELEHQIKQRICWDYKTKFYETIVHQNINFSIGKDDKKGAVAQGEIRTLQSIGWKPDEI